MKSSDEVLTEVMNNSPYKTNFPLSRKYILQAMEEYAQQFSNLHERVVKPTLAGDEEFTWQTDYAHSDNMETMQEYLDSHLPKGYHIIEHDGTYAEVVKGDKIGIHASGDGDFTHHKVTFEKC